MSRALHLRVRATAMALAVCCALAVAPVWAKRGRGHSEPEDEPVCPNPRVACKKWAANPGFNYFAFQQSWSAEFCYGKSLTAEANKRRYPNCPNLGSLPLCDTPTAQMCNALTIHGLWATSESFKPPQHGPYCCSEGADFNIGLFPAGSAIRADLNTYWPDEATADSPAADDGSGAGFHEYEWDKHGTCSGYDQTPFFQTAMSIHKRLPTPFRSPWCGDGSGASQPDMTLTDGVYELRVSAAQAATKYQCAPYASANGQMSRQCVEFGCTNGYLSDITTCWGDTNNDGSLDQIACGPSVTTLSANQKCGASFKVTFFPSEKCAGADAVACPP